MQPQLLHICEVKCSSSMKTAVCVRSLASTSLKGPLPLQPGEASENKGQNFILLFSTSAAHQHGSIATQCCGVRTNTAHLLEIGLLWAVEASPQPTMGGRGGGFFTGVAAGSDCSPWTGLRRVGLAVNNLVGRPRTKATRSSIARCRCISFCSVTD